MEYNEEYIQGLLFEKVAGTISDEDNLIAEQAIAHDIRAREFWETLLVKMKGTRGNSFLSGIDPDAAWNNTQPRFNEIQDSFFKRNRWLLSSAAAILLLALPFIWYFTSTKGTAAADQEQISRQVHLKTENGAAVDLSSDRVVTLGHARFNASQKELTYAAGEVVRKEWATLVVPAAKDYSVNLSDGTKVWLNAASSLRFPVQFGKEQAREVYLSGEAYFEVTKNLKQEFIVHTNSADIHVHGTSFNVNAYDGNRFATALIEGSVSATTKNQNLRLKPGQEVILEAQNLQVRPFDAQEVLSWRKGTYFFHKQPLSEIAAVLSRWFDVKIAWQTPGIAEQAFTGEIDKKLSIEVVLANLQLSSGIKAELKNGTLTFR
ncbi:transmembrane sensor [Pedobacter africanus]|uniref:Ferric-dicitrate binding protein FerR (Iron transport regulator) n=1 Tax=Pedobacter africanus TaxID=151894 RepID=A0ACC6KTX7_9SPHI|nr:FecR domain-containing protein [Pedobacter africanus]MDR6782595.1 ferric-dicitrate binding protein FerR (iron transport regulator) [Pedobacter africanus]